MIFLFLFDPTYLLNIIKINIAIFNGIHSIEYGSWLYAFFRLTAIDFAPHSC